MTEQYLVTFTVGPVQSFIASARKVEDFWSGSYILSHLVREALRIFFDKEQEMNLELVFPVVKKRDIIEPNLEELHIASLPNRITAIVTGDEAEVVSLLRNVEKHVRSEFYNIAYAAIDRVFADATAQEQNALQQQTTAQLDNLLEMYWVAQPLNKAEFSDTRLQLERRLGALKNEKQFGQIDEHGLTCSVCKSKEALTIERVEAAHSYKEMKEQLASTWAKRTKAYQGKRIKDNEFLCGVCLMKRHARDYFKEHFNVKMAQGFKRFDAIADIVDEDEGYYAILMLDGDNMGQHLTGNDVTTYQDVSKKLAKFAGRKVPEIVEKNNKGVLVYAGGDDVLAFMPVPEALQIAQQLRFAFSDEQGGLGKNATASAGLVVAHVKAPLQLLLDEVRKLEKKAKAYPNKNALAIGVHTRSGEISETVLPWTTSTQHATVDLLQRVITLLKEDVSTTFIHRFTEAFLPLLDAEQYKKVPKYLVETELRRLMKRARKTDLRDEQLEDVLQQLITLHEEQNSTKDFIYLLKIMRFFERKDGVNGDVTATTN
ncbi:type III-B CRISPR-associated protein Cas10/Cmr2 [Caryophanon latum]|uniref:Type III-B CRISPR-associated protein Cas10/Cmr2 n=1 Tax=Caryophanon latum TaxID=33977 RepID=A0A1C0YV39_9BACL|nr:type III-B CRISPR-associated protein Cas10/Cmr2 [Caryophanon latum]OCS91025.1 type III-B CRISPR-associated protein Cas10/Cmr2 [Caryophanon latum]